MHGFIGDQIHWKHFLCSFYCRKITLSVMVTSYLAFTCSKLTIETFYGVVLVSLLLTLNINNILF